MTDRKLTNKTERMRQEKLTLDKSNVFETIFDSLGEAVLVVDSTGRELFRNRAFDRLHFTVQDQVPIEQWSDAFGVYLPGGEVLCPYEQLPMVRAMRGEIWDEVELEYVGLAHPDGLPISVNARPLMGPEGVVGGVIAIRENSGRKKISEALKESEEQYRCVVESLAEGIVIHAADGPIIASNDRAGEILGLTSEEIIGRGALDPRWAAIREDGSPLKGADHPAMVVLRTGNPLFNTIMGVRTPLGALTWVTVNAVPIVSAKGTQKGVVASFHDITEARDLNRRLEERTQKLSELNEQLQLEVKNRLLVEESYRAVVEDQTEVVCRMRADGTFLFVNEVFCRTFGKSQSELEGKLWQPGAHRDDVGLVAAKLASLSPQTPIVIVENRIYDAEGNIRWMEFVNRGFFDSTGTLTEIQAVGRDITDRKQIEEQLRNSLQEKEILLKEIHHRVKNNLQVVSTLLDLQSGYTQDRAASEMFRESRGRVKSMALIHENLYRSQNMSLVNVHENISQLVEHLRVSYDVSGVEITVDVGPAELHIDVAITCALLINELLSNCLKHAFPDSSCGSIRVSLQQFDDSHCILTVADDGVGFPTSISFRDTKSFGVKLVHMLARQLRGTVDMQLDHGTQISITFPANIKSSH